MKPINNAAISAITAKPSGHDIPLAEFAANRGKAGVERFLFTPKKVPPPTPEGREGRLFPPEHSWKTGFVVAELTGRGNKILLVVSSASWAVIQRGASQLR